jgi:hypothetical protein
MKEKNKLFIHTGALIALLLLLLISSKNLIYLFLIFGLIMVFIASIFKIKNLDHKLYYVYITPILVLQGVTLIYIYLFKSIYLYDVYWILYCVFVMIFIFSVFLWINYYIYRH